MQIYLIRHGQTDWNKKFLIQGISDKLLNDTGKEQAKEIVHFFDEVQPTKLISSPLSRAKETLSIIKTQQKWDLKIVENPSFLERDFGELEGKEVTAYTEATDLSKYQGFEHNKQIEQRVSQGIEEIVNKSKNDEVVVITCHAHTMKSFLVNYFPQTYTYQYKLKNCAIIKVDIPDNKLDKIKLEIVN
ncbi:MAG: histidine phosphatase family protein [Mycoplasmatales bacterium]